MEVEPLRELEKREEKREEDGLRGAVEVPAVCVLLRAVSVGVRAPVVSLEEMEGLMRRQSESPQLRELLGFLLVLDEDVRKQIRPRDRLPMNILDRILQARFSLWYETASKSQSKQAEHLKQFLETNFGKQNPFQTSQQNDRKTSFLDFSPLQKIRILFQASEDLIDSLKQNQELSQYVREWKGTDFNTFFLGRDAEGASYFHFRFAGDTRIYRMSSTSSEVQDQKIANSFEIVAEDTSQLKKLMEKLDKRKQVSKLLHTKLGCILDHIKEITLAAKLIPTNQETTKRKYKTKRSRLISEDGEDAWFYSPKRSERLKNVDYSFCEKRKRNIDTNQHINKEERLSEIGERYLLQLEASKRKLKTKF